MHVVLLIVAGVGSNQESLNGPVAIERSERKVKTRSEFRRESEIRLAYVFRSGIHCTVRLGQVSACEYKVS